MLTVVGIKDCVVSNVQLSKQLVSLLGLLPKSQLGDIGIDTMDLPATFY